MTSARPARGGELAHPSSDDFWETDLPGSGYAHGGAAPCSLGTLFAWDEPMFAPLGRSSGGDSDSTDDSVLPNPTESRELVIGTVAGVAIGDQVSSTTSQLEHPHDMLAVQFTSPSTMPVAPSLRPSHSAPTESSHAPTYESRPRQRFRHETKSAKSAKNSVGLACNLGAAGETVACPLCQRSCEGHHRLGYHWGKFGYDGPPYCSRCASVFRAHMIKQNVSPNRCHRDQPCGTCTKVLERFTCTHQEAYARIDDSVASRPRSFARDAANDDRLGKAASCPYCGKVLQTRNLGMFWRKFGYTGRPYCGECSSRFRNHMIRQKGGAIELGRVCTRTNPCAMCRQILSNFGTPTGTQPTSTTFCLVDTKSRAPDSGAAALIAANKRRLPPPTDNQCVGAGNELHNMNESRLQLFKRAKQSSPTTCGSLPYSILAPITLVVAMVVCVVGYTGFHNNSWYSPASDDSTHDDPAAAKPIVSNDDVVAGCEDGDLFFPPQDDRFSFQRCCGSATPPAWDHPSLYHVGYVFDTNSRSVRLQPGDKDAANMNATDRQCWEGKPQRCSLSCRGYCTAAATDTGKIQRGMPIHAKCLGPIGSTCEFTCPESYRPEGELRCLPGNFSYQGKGHCVYHLPQSVVDFFSKMHNLSLTRNASAEPP